MTNDAIDRAVYAILRKFVDRLRVVYGALRDLRPDLIMALENQGTPAERTAARLKYARGPGRGFWGENNEWAYRLHGIGCHLTHTQTGEILGWDVGHSRRFDVSWFIDYLRWYVESHPDETTTQGLQPYLADPYDLDRLVQAALNRCVEQGLIRPSNGRYILLSAEPEPWYLAEIVEEISNGETNVVYVNLVLVQATNAEDAYEKALKLGTDMALDDTLTLNDQPATSRFRGLRDLNLIHDPLGHGAEIIFEQHDNLTNAQITALVNEKRNLGVFQSWHPGQG